MNKKNILVGQSGGPTAVINGSLYGVICEGARHSDAVGCVYGMINGIEGFLADSYMNLSETLSDDNLELLRLTPAAYLGSCRFKLPENLSDSFYRVLFEKLERLDIGYSFTSAATTRWTPSASFPAMRRRSKVRSALSAFPRRSTTISF